MEGDFTIPAPAWCWCWCWFMAIVYCKVMTTLTRLLLVTCVITVAQLTSPIHQATTRQCAHQSGDGFHDCSVDYFQDGLKSLFDGLMHFYSPYKIQKWVNWSHF